eukprot:766248-Hanusia_phi.AAC.8
MPLANSNASQHVVPEKTSREKYDYGKPVEDRITINRLLRTIIPESRRFVPLTISDNKETPREDAERHNSHDAPRSSAHPPEIGPAFIRINYFHKLNPAKKGPAQNRNADLVLVLE